MQFSQSEGFDEQQNKQYGKGSEWLNVSSYNFWFTERNLILKRPMSFLNDAGSIGMRASTRFEL